MGFLSDFFGRQTDTRRHARRRKTGRQSSPMMLKPARLALEPLEKRELLTVLYWDSNGVESGVGGAGTWDTSTALWREGSETGTLTTWQDGAQAIFTGSADTVTLDTNVTAATITIQDQDANDYTLNGSGLITLSGSTGIEVAQTGQSATIGVPISLAASQSWTVASGSTLSVGDAVGLSSYTLTVNGAGNTSVAGVIGGSGNTGSLTKSGSGVLTLSATNDYTGATAIQDGKIVLSGGNDRLPTTTTVTLGVTGTNTSGKLQLGDTNGGSNQQLARLVTSGTGGENRVVGGATVVSTLTIFANAGCGYAGFLGGTEGNENQLKLVKKGTAVCSFTGNNTYSGGTEIYSGGYFYLSGASADPLHNPLGSGPVTLYSGSRLSIDFTTDRTISNVISGSGTLCKAATSAVVTLVGDNPDFSGTTILSGGVLVIDKLSQLGTGRLWSGASGGTLRYTGTSDSTTRVTSLGPIAFDVVNENTSLTWNISSGAIGGTFTKTGAGSLTLNGPIVDAASVTVNAGKLVLSGVNTYIGNTTINAGTLLATTATAIPAYASVSVNNGGTFAVRTDVNGATGWSEPQIASLLGAATFSTGSALGFETPDASSFPYAGSIDGPQGLTKTGTGTLVLSGVNTYTGGTTINGGILQINSDSSLGAVNANNTIRFTGDGTLQAAITTPNSMTLDVSRTITIDSGKTATIDVLNAGSFEYVWLSVPATINGDGNLRKTGAWYLNLSGNNTYAGTTTIDVGTLEIGNYGSAGTLGRGDVIINGSGNGWLRFKRSDNIVVDNAIHGTGGLSQNANGTLTLVGYSEYTHNYSDYTGGTGTNNGTIIAEHISDTGWSGIGHNGFLRIAPDTTFKYTGSEDASIAGRLDNARTGGTIEVANSGVTLSLTSTTPTTESVTKAGPGTLSLACPIIDLKDENDVLVRTASVSVNAGTLILSGANTYSGGTTIASGATLQVGAGGTTGSLGSSSGAVDNSGLLVFDRSGVAPVGNAIHGSGRLEKRGAGTVTLSGVNTYGGGTVVSGGILGINSNDALGDAQGEVTLAAGTTLRAAASPVVLPVSRTIIISSGTATFDTQANAMSVAGIIDGAGTLTKDGWGILTLTGANEYEGGTIINGGVFEINSNNALGNGEGDITFTRSATLRATATPIALPTARAIAINNSAVATFDTQDNAMSLAGLISGGSLRKTGSGTLILENTNNTYSGMTTISQGTLSASSIVVSNGHSSLGNAESPVVLGDATTKGTLSYTGNTAVYYTRGFSVNGGGGQIDVSTADQTLYLAAGDIVAYGELTFGGAGNTYLSSSSYISGPGSLIKIGAGTLTISSSNNSFRGGTIIFEGTLRLAGGVSNCLYTDGTITVNGGALDLGQFSQSASGVFLYDGTITNGTLSTSYEFRVYNGVVSAVLAGTGSLIKDSTGTVSLLRANTFYGATQIGEGTLVLSHDGYGSGQLPSGSDIYCCDGTVFDLGQNSQSTTGEVSFLGGTVINGWLAKAGGFFNAQSGTISAFLTGTAGLEKRGNGLLTLTNNAYYTGDTLVYAGTLHLSGDAEPLYYNSNLTTSDVKVYGGVLDLGDDAMAHALTLTGKVEFLGGTVQNGTIVKNGGDFYGEFGTVTASLMGTAGLEKDGSLSDLTLSGENGFTGATRIITGVLVLGHEKALGMSTLNMHSSDYGALSFGTLTSATLGGLMGSRGISLQNPAAAPVALYVGANGDSTEYSGSLTGSGSLTLIGGAVLELSGTSSYTGATTIAEGELFVNGNIATSPLTISSIEEGASAFLTGEGTVGPITANNGAVYPGDEGDGLLHTGNLVLNADSVFLADLIASSYGNQLNVTGSVTLNNAMLDVYSVRESDWGAGVVLIINDGTDAVVGKFKAYQDGEVRVLDEGGTFVAGGIRYLISYDYNSETGSRHGGNDVLLLDVSSTETEPSEAVITFDNGGYSGSGTGTVTYHDGRIPDAVIDVTFTTGVDKRLTVGRERLSRCLKAGSNILYAGQVFQCIHGCHTKSDGAAAMSVTFANPTVVRSFDLVGRLNRSVCEENETFPGSGVYIIGTLKLYRNGETLPFETRLLTVTAPSNDGVFRIEDTRCSTNNVGRHDNLVFNKTFSLLADQAITKFEITDVTRIAFEDAAAGDHTGDGPGGVTWCHDWVGQQELGIDNIRIKTISDPAEITLQGEASINEGSLYSLTVGQAGDALVQYVVRVDWGDGSMPELYDHFAAPQGEIDTILPLPANRVLTHTYADGASTPTITVSWMDNVRDRDGNYMVADSTTKSVNVLNVAPVLSIPDDQTVSEGQLLTLSTIGTFTDCGFDNPLDTPATWEQFTYEIAWGDNSDNSTGTATIDVVGSAGVLTQGSFGNCHIYADNGTYTVTVTLYGDDYGGVVNDVNDKDVKTFHVTVNNVAPTIELLGGGAVGHWKLDETSGTLAADSSGFGHTGTFVGTGQQWVAGQFNGALAFDGTNQVQIDNVGVNTAAGAYNTVSFWMKWDGTLGRMPFGWNSAYDLWFDSNRFGFNTGRGDILGIVVPTGAWTNTWVHVAAVFYNGVTSANTLRLYINGQLQQLTQWGTPNVDGRSVSSTAFLSGFGASTANRFIGSLDDVRIFNRALTDAEAADLANASLLGNIRSVPEGSPYTLTLGPVIDPGDDTVTSYIIHWGDGTPDTTFDSVNNPLPNDRRVSHVYDDGPATHSITVDLIDEDGQFNDVAAACTITVVNVAPTVTVSDGNLIGCWRLDEGSGTTAADSSGYGRIGTFIGGPQWVDGHSGQAVQFNGGTDEVRVNNLAIDMRDGAKNTVSFWMKWDGTANVMPFGWYNYDLYLCANGANNIFGFHTCQSDCLGIVVPSSWVNNWVHVVAVFNNGAVTADTVQLFINGQEQTLSNLRGGTAVLPRRVSPTAHISGYGGGTSYRFRGAIDEVRIYDRGLTDGEVAALFAGDPNTITEGTTRHYTFTTTDPGWDTFQAPEVSLSSAIGEVSNLTFDQLTGAGSFDITFFDGPGSTIVGVRVDDSDGAASPVASIPISVVNVAPTLTVVGDQEVSEGELLDLTDLGVFTDPGFDSETFTYTIDWGDNITQSGLQVADVTQGQPGILTSGSFDGSHTYSTRGQYPVTVTLSDDDGGVVHGTFMVTVVTNTPPRYTTDAVLDAYVDTAYIYDVKATDDDSDTLTFTLDTASLDRGMAIAPIDNGWARITWTPGVAWQDESVPVTISVTDGVHDAVPQSYNITVHPDPLNNPPVITSKPSVNYRLPEAIAATGIVSPTEINLELGPDDTYNTSVQVTIPDIADDIEVDVVFVVDESDSMRAQHAWLAGMVSDLDDAFNDLNIVRRYGLVGFGTTEESSNWAHTHYVGGGLFGDALQVITTMSNELNLVGGYEDGWNGIDFALDNYPFAEDASVQVILITDEDRWSNDATLTYAGVLQDLLAHGAMLNVVVNSRYYASGTTYALGVDSDGNAYLPNGQGGYTSSQGYTFAYDYGATHEQYVDMAWATGGATWDLNQLRQGGLLATSFTRAFVDIKVQEILSQFPIDAVADDPIFENLEGVLVGGPDDLLSFDIRLSGDGQAHSFDIEFVRQGTGTVIGSIPVYINGDAYVYDVDASDADNDTLTYELVVDELHPDYGASINASTGRLTWTPDAIGNYDFKVKVTDGQGGEDSQTWTIAVGSQVAGNSSPQIESVPLLSAYVDHPYYYSVVASDADHDTLRYYLRSNSLIDMTIDRDTGVIRWVEPVAGTYNLSIYVSDGRGGFATQELPLVVSDTSELNHPPAITSQAPITAYDEEIYRYLAYATDADAVTLTYRLLKAPPAMAINGTTGAISWKPTVSDIGTHDVILMVSDEHGAYDLQSFTIRVVSRNNAPEIISDPYGPAAQNALWSYQVVATDLNGDALTYTLDADSIARGMVINAESNGSPVPGLIGWTPTTIGVYYVSITVADGRGGFDGQGFYLEVSDQAPPKFTSIPTGPAIVSQTWSYGLEAEDPNAGQTATLVYSLDQASIDRGIEPPIPGYPPTGNNNTISWTPTEPGEYEITVKATDTTGLWTTQTFTLKVVPAATPSEPPVITSLPPAPAWGDPIPEYVYELAGYDPDDANATLVFSAAPENTVGTVAWDSERGKYVFRWTNPTVGEHPVAILLTDETGAWAMQTFKLVYTAPIVNNLPEFTVGTIPGAQATQPWTAEFYVADPDVGDIVSISLDKTSQDLGITAEQDPLDSTHWFLHWTPDTDNVGTHTITVIADDHKGTGVAQLVITLPVVPAESTPDDADYDDVENQPPTISSVPDGWIRIGNEYQYQLAANDPDGDNDNLVYSLDSAPAAMTVDQTGLVRWTPEVVGDYPIAIRVTDEGGAGVIQSYTLRVVAAVALNEPPEITSEPTGPAVFNMPYYYQVTAEDPNGDAFSFSFDLDEMSADLAALMSIDSTTGLLTWSSPTAGSSYCIAVKVTETKPIGALSSTQIFYLTVLDNAKPRITNYPTGDDAVFAPNVEKHFTFTAEDPNDASSTLRFSLENAPPEMSIDAETGEFTWTPSAAGSHVFTVKVTDPHGATGRLSFEVVAIATGVNNAPAIDSQPRETIQGGMTFWHQVEASDEDYDILTYSLLDSPQGMTIDSKTGMIRWVTTEAHVRLEPYSYTIVVDDGRGQSNSVVEKLCSIKVVAVGSNTAPTITTEKLHAAIVDDWYSVAIAATDPEGDPITWSLDATTKPASMEIDPDTGVITWTPTDADLAGRKITVRATDAYGAYVDRTYTIDVFGGNHTPRIASSLPTEGNAEQPYTRQLTGYDVDGDDYVFSVDAPAGSGLSVSADGLVTFAGGVVGVYDVTFTITEVRTDGKTPLSSSIGPYTFHVVGDNEYPKINSTPYMFAYVGQQYKYAIDAEDPDFGQTATLIYEVSASTLQNTPSWNGHEWQVVIAPADYDDGNNCYHEIFVTVTDSGGLAWVQYYTLTVLAANSAPTIALSSQTVFRGQKFEYDITASDSDPDEDIRFSLANEPDGMTIVKTGPKTARIEWQTNADTDVPAQPVTVIVTDRCGESASNTFGLTLSSDTTAPNVSFTDVPAGANVGQSVSVRFVATDDASVVGRTVTMTLTRDGNTVCTTSLVVDGNGWVSIPTNDHGTLTLNGAAWDAAGNRGTTSACFNVAPKSDHPLTLAIQSPENGEKIDAVMDVVVKFGNTDSDVITTWNLSIAPAGESTFRRIATGTSPVLNTALCIGAIDSTLLADGAYTLRLQAFDAGGHSSYMDKEFLVKDTVKLGDFSLSFVDLQIPVAGIPITVTRSYDTLNASQNGELGYGWKISIADTKMSVLNPNGDYFALGEGAVLNFTLPDGTKQSFVFAPTAVSQVGVTTYYTPTFYSRDRSSGCTLSGPVAYLYSWGNGKYYETGASQDTGCYEDYYPGHYNQNDAYTLTTRDGTQYVIAANTGKLYSVIDRNGNTLYYLGDGIYTDPYGNGVGIQFTKVDGRIVTITDPAGQTISYGYDSITDDLTTVTNREGETTTYIYDEAATGRPHFLTEIVDSRDVTVLKATFYPDDYEDAKLQGRLWKLTDGAGNEAQIGYNRNLGDGLHLQSVTDAYGVPTESVQDDRGNVVRKIEHIYDAGTSTWTYQVTVSEFVYDGDTLKTSRTSFPFVVPALEDRFTYLPDAANPLVWQTTSKLDQFGNVTSSTDALGNITQYEYDSYGRTEVVTDALQNRTYTNYDDYGNLRSTTDATHVTTSYGYNDQGLPTSISDDLGKLLGSFQYDDNGRLTTSTSATGQTTRFCYDAIGNQVLSYYAWTDPNDSQTKKTIVSRTIYDAESRVTGTKQYEISGERFFTAASQLDNYSADITQESSTVYNAAGQVEKSVDALGLETWNFYDVRGLLVQTLTEAFDTGAASNQHKWIVTRTIYDKNGRTVYTAESFDVNFFTITDAASCPSITAQATQGAHTVYDSLGRVESTEQVANLYVDVVKAGSLWVASVKDGTASGIAVLSASQTHYDSAGRVDYTLDEFGTRTEYTYDVAGRTIQTRTGADTNWLVTRTAYDALGRTVAVTDAFIEGAATADITGTRYSYDAAGRTLCTKYVQGLDIRIPSDASFPANAKPTAILSAEGAVVWQTESIYDAAGQMIASVGRHGPVESGPRTDYYYDAAGRQKCVLGPVVQVELDTDGVLESARLITEYVYDAAGRQQSVTTNVALLDSTGNFALHPSDADVFAPANRDSTHAQTTSYEYDEAGRQTAVISSSVADPDNPTQTTHIRTETVYDALGRKIAVRENIKQSDPANPATIDSTNVRETSYEYDSMGRLSAVILPEVERPSGGAGMVHPRHEYTYDAHGNQTGIRDNVYQVGANVYYDHDGLANDFSQAYDTRVTVFTYNEQGQEETRTLPIGVSTTDPTDFVESKFYGDAALSSIAAGDLHASVCAGQLKYEVSFEGIVTAYLYDNRAGSGGRLAKKLYYASLSAYNNGAGVPTEVVVYAYDAFGRQTSASQYDGAMVAYWKMDDQSGTSTGDASGNEHIGTLLGNAAISNKTVTLNGTGDGVRVAENADLDISGAGATLTISARVYANQLSSYQYIIAKRNGTTDNTVQYGVFVTSGGRIYFCTRASGEARSLSGVITAGAWHDVVVTYDGTGASPVVHFYVDGVDVTDPNYATCAVIHDTSSPLYIGARGASESDPDALTISWNGKLDDVCIFNHVLSAEAVTAGTSRTTENVYDNLGQLITVASPEGTIHYEYDSVTGLQTAAWTGMDAEATATTDTQYEYDDLGRLSQVRQVRRNGQDIDIDENAAGYQPEVTDYVYDLMGNLDKVSLPNGVVSDYDYDSLNRLVSLKEFNDTDRDGVFDLGENLLAQFDYDLLADGKRSGVVETDADGHQTRIDWLYDDLGRLTEEQYDRWNDDLDFTAQYAYDLVGNRRSKTVDEGSDSSVDETITYEYDANDRLLSEFKDRDGTANDATTLYEYGPNADPENGVGGDYTQQTKKSVFDSSHQPLATSHYSYNLQGRMSQSSVDADGDGSDPAVVTTYEYDDSGVRVGQTEDGVETRYLNDKQNPTGYSQVLEEKNATGGIVRTYTLGLDVIGQKSESPAAYTGPLFLLYDGHGSTRQLVDATGQIINANGALQVFRYDAFGNRLDTVAALTTLLYSGEQTDGTGLQYLRARYYDPNTGRFNRLDPFAGDMNDPLSLHKYLCCYGDVVNGFDPTGRWKVGGPFGSGLGGGSPVHEDIGLLAAIKAGCFGFAFNDGLTAGVRWTDMPEGFAGLAFIPIAEYVAEWPGWLFAPETMASHMGENVYYHGMVPYKDGSPVHWTAQQMVTDYLLPWFRQQYTLALTLTGYEQGKEIGKIIHSLSDIYCQSHVQRETGIGRITMFQDYGLQNTKKHGTADYRNGDTEPFFQAAVGASAKLLTFLRQGAPWKDVSRWLETGPLALAPGAQVGGTDPAYARDKSLSYFDVVYGMDALTLAGHINMLNTFIDAFAFNSAFCVGF